MQPSIPVGTVLQNRYRILSVLGQGGFGRTYLAEDLGRFNERCAIKEFIPSQASSAVLDKSKELFQREATILYQIQHPQIPQFRATFEENQRLFLVQDYVEGKTYRTLLNERKAQGVTFSEGEVLQLMQQLLPVLAHIHSRGIIHRDIAPDNVIQRRQDRVPVLIDFGVVKEIVTRVQTVETAAQSTTVGKAGYAPSEQMQTGRSYPSSDLYALAATALVLLTGKEPQELFDDNTLTWQWQQWADVNPAFAQVINRMLSYRPGDRYQSVSEVAQALQAINNPAAAPLPPPALNAPSAAPSQPDTSQMRTMAVGRRPEPDNRPYNPPRTGPMIPTPSEKTVWDNPWAVVAIFIGLALITAIGSWAVVNAILRSPTETPTPTETVTETVSPSPTAEEEPIEYSQRLNLAPGETNTTESSLAENETVTYIVPAEQGQTLRAELEGEGVLMTVLGPNQEPVDSRSERVLDWEGTLDFTGNYYIRLRTVRGIPESDYRLSVSLEAAPEPEPEPTPTETESPSPVEPTFDEQRLRFPAGAEGTEVSGRSSPQVIKRYVVNAEAGQVMNVEVQEGAVALDIRYPDGELVEDASGVVFWQAQLPEGGDYLIDVIATRPENFTLDVSVYNLE